MKKIILLSVVLMIAIESRCQQSYHSLIHLANSYGISRQTVDNWKKDRFGCLGLRTIDSSARLVGMPQAIFLRLFGRPEHQSSERLKNNHYITYYFITRISCSGSKPTHKSDITRWVVTFKNNRVLSQHYMVE